jgi:hypothetical protein
MSYYNAKNRTFLQLNLPRAIYDLFKEDLPLYSLMLLSHLINCTVGSTYCNDYPEDEIPWIPVSAKLIKEELSLSTRFKTEEIYTSLITQGLIELNEYDYTKGKSREFRLTNKVIDLVLPLYYADILKDETVEIVNIKTGRKITPRHLSVSLSDESKHRYPELTCQALLILNKPKKYNVAALKSELNKMFPIQPDYISKDARKRNIFVASKDINRLPLMQQVPALAIRCSIHGWRSCL